jgi:hypothetical protein
MAAQVFEASPRAPIFPNSVPIILKNRRERAPSGATERPLLIHEYIRGPDYYH